MAPLATFVAFNVSLPPAVIPSLSEPSCSFVGSDPCFLLALIHVPPGWWLVRVQDAQYKLWALGVLSHSGGVVSSHGALQLIALG